MHKSLLAIVLSLFFVIGCASRVEIQDIHTNLQNSYQVDKVQQAIVDSLAQRGWFIQSKQNGQIAAKFEKGTHVVDIQVNYTGNSFDIKYINSVDMDVSDNKISRKYLQWVNNLNKDIQVNLSKTI